MLNACSKINLDQFLKARLIVFPIPTPSSLPPPPPKGMHLKKDSYECGTQDHTHVQQLYLHGEAVVAVIDIATVVYST